MVRPGPHLGEFTALPQGLAGLRGYFYGEGREREEGRERNW